MKKNLLFVFVVVLSFSQLIAQEGGVFTVIISKGNNKLMDEATFKFIKVGAAVNAGQSLMVAENGYLALVHNETGKGLELNAAGDYKVQDLQAALSAKENSVLSKYGKFLMTNMLQQADNNQNLNVTGAVERGSESIIPVYLPKVTDVYGSELLVTWRKMDNISEYIVTVKNKTDQTVYQKNVTGTRFILHLDDLKVKYENLLIVNVQAKGNSILVSRDYGIRRVDAVQRENIQREYSTLIEAANTENTLGKLLIASFFEEQQLTADAMGYYESAVNTSSDPDGFAVLYESFLTRNGLK